MKGTLIDAISMVPTIEIVEELSIPSQKRNGKVYLLCPGHDDHHFGSCYIDKSDNGYYCYACGLHVTKWQMLAQNTNWSKKEIANWFFVHSGITPDSEIDPLIEIRKKLKKLGRILDTSPIYRDTNACKKKESPYGRTAGGSYLISEAVDNNPLFTMYMSNRDMLMRIVNNSIERKVERLKALEKKSDVLASAVREEIEELINLREGLF